MVLTGGILPTIIQYYPPLLPEIFLFDESTGSDKRNGFIIKTMESDRAVFLSSLPICFAFMLSIRQPIIIMFRLPNCLKVSCFIL